ALILPVDVSDRAEVEKAAATIERELGPIDVWINNAMVSVLSQFQETTADDFRRVTEVTYLGVVYGTMAALRYMVPRNRGTIVQAGSSDEPADPNRQGNLWNAVSKDFGAHGRFDNQAHSRSLQLWAQPIASGWPG